MGFSRVAIPEPTENALHGHAVIGLLFSADWCRQCSVFTPVLERLYRARRTDHFEIVLVSRCREAKATKYHREDMPWLAMGHKVDDEAGMAAHTASLMAKFGITSIPALVLLDKRGGLICANAQDKCVADPEGRAFPWRKQSQSTATARTAGRGPVVNFDLPPRARLRPEPTCARPQAFTGVSAGDGSRITTTRGTALGWPLGGPVGKRDGADTTTARTRGGHPPSFAQDKHEMAQYDSMVIDEDLARLAEARDREAKGTQKSVSGKGTQKSVSEKGTQDPVSGRTPGVGHGEAPPADIEDDIRRPPADIHARARRAKDAKRKNPPDIVDAGLPPKKPNRIATRGVPTVYPDAMKAVGDSERARRDGTWVPRSLSARPEGKPTSLMQPQPLAGVHPFTPTLTEWRHGIEVDCGPDWTWDVIEDAVARGPHPTARTPEAIALFEEDIEYQRRAGFCKIFTWEELKQTRPTNLKISPVAAVPQVGRRPRIILDLSFPVYQDVDGVITATQASVNDTTALRAPKEAVREIGKVLPRLLTYMRDTPAGLHILMSKLDISDGFWRLIVRGEDCFNFAYVLPQREGEPCRIVVPSAVQMGWVESPSLFCAVTETARDLAQHFVDAAVPLPPHHVESSMAIEDVPMRGRDNKPSKLLQVYVDDFCYAATQSRDGTHIPTIRRAAIHGIEAVFPPPAITNHKDGKEPISESKLLKGDGNFESKKDMIGFSFDGIKRTVHLPPKKAAAYIRETHRLLRRKSVPLKLLQSVVGKLRHASIILPAARGFFTPINAAMKGSPKKIILGAKSEVRAALEDLCTLLRILASRPTHVKELVPDMPQYVGYHDAAADGAGGVWFSLLDNMYPTVWRVEFPQDITSEVVSDNNPEGRLTNSDLELAAEVMAVAVALSVAPKVKHVPLGTLCDNTPTVSWIEKLASKAKGPTAGRLLRGLAVMLHGNKAGRLTTVHVPGVDNVMADVASRPAKAQKMFRAETPLSDTDFRSSFDIAFPLPDNQAWTLAEVPQWVKLCVFETLRGKRLALQRWTGPNATGTGERGRRTAGSTPKISNPTTHRAHQPTNYSRLLSPCGKASTASEIKSRFSQSSGLCGMSPKGSFWTDTLTHAVPPRDSTPLTSQ